jgi:transposase
MSDVGGRPTSLTPEVQAKIIDAIELGMYVKQACLAAGICEKTYYLWKQRGETGEEPFAGFLQALQIAEAKAELRALKNITSNEEPTGPHWTASAWFLERKHWKRWGRKDRTEQKKPDAAGASMAELMAAAVAAVETNRKSADGGDK